MFFDLLAQPGDERRDGLHESITGFDVSGEIGAVGVGHFRDMVAAHALTEENYRRMIPLVELEGPHALAMTLRHDKDRKSGIKELCGQRSAAVVAQIEPYFLQRPGGVFRSTVATVGSDSGGNDLELVQRRRFG